MAEHYDYTAACFARGGHILEPPTPLAAAAATATAAAATATSDATTAIPVISGQAK